MFHPIQSLLQDWSEKFRTAAGKRNVSDNTPRGSPTADLTASLAPLLVSSAGASFSPTISVAKLWNAAIDQGPLPIALLTNEGWLVPWMQSEGIETWQEAELICLHALSWSALHDPTWQPRLRSAALQCIAELQPDNVTGRPWACHVFAWISAMENNTEASMYAQTLVHNAMVARTDIEPVSAAILTDAAHWLASLAAD